jgi:hypothetical protein
LCTADDTIAGMWKYSRSDPINVTITFQDPTLRVEKRRGRRRRR